MSRNSQPEIEIVRSVVATETVKALFAERYACGLPTSCKLHSVMLNDVYIVSTAQDRYAFRIRYGGLPWLCEPSSFRFELDLLALADDRGVPVARPVAQRDGSLLGALQTPEGERYFAVHRFAPGRPVYPPSEEQARLLGSHLASFHLVAHEFPAGNAPPRFDAALLLHRPMLRIFQTMGGRRQEDEEFLRELEPELADWLNGLPTTGNAFGIIGGGVNGVNHHVAADGQITMFGFTLCGYGWRAFDLAVFLGNARILGASKQACEAFVEGYQSRRSLSAEELAAIPALMKVKMIFTMGCHMEFAAWMGGSFLDDGYWERHCSLLR
jgi:Ser/Thr protein kinase RdoA (MazF antagonist)